MPVSAIALSARGRVCWQVPLTVPKEGTHTSNEPVTKGGTAFFSTDGEVRAVAVATGRRSWTWSSGSAERRLKVHSAVDGMVVVTKDQSLVGLNESTGALRWEQPWPLGVGSSPRPTGDGGMLFSLFSGEVSQVVDSTSGRIRWQGRQAPMLGPGATPVAAVLSGPAIVGDAVVSTLTSGGAAAVSLRSGSELWRSAGPFSQATAAGGVVVLTPPPGPAGAYEVQATAVDPASGRPLWQTAPFEPGGTSFSEAAGALVFGDFSRLPTLARLDPMTGTDVWRMVTRPWRTVAAGDRLVGVESGQGTTTVVSRDLATGAVRWETPAPFSVQNTNFQLLPVQSEGGDVIVLVVGRDLTAFESTTGAVAWTFTLPGSALLDGITAADGGLMLQASGCEYRVVNRGSGPCPGTR